MPQVRLLFRGEGYRLEAVHSTSASTTAIGRAEPYAEKHLRTFHRASPHVIQSRLWDKIRLWVTLLHATLLDHPRRFQKIAYAHQQRDAYVERLLLWNWLLHPLRLSMRTVVVCVGTLHPVRRVVQTLKVWLWLHLRPGHRER